MPICSTFVLIHLLIHYVSVSIMNPSIHPSIIHHVSLSIILSRLRIHSLEPLEPLPFCCLFVVCLPCPALPCPVCLLFVVYCLFIVCCLFVGPPGSILALGPNFWAHFGPGPFPYCCPIAYCCVISSVYCIQLTLASWVNQTSEASARLTDSGHSSLLHLLRICTCGPILS